MSVGTELLAVPFPQMVRNLGVGIAQAQFELDMVSLKIPRMMAGYAVDENPSAGADPTARPYLVKFSDGAEYSLLELGLTPTFYQFVDTVIELKVSISTSSEIEQSSSSSRTSAAGGWFLFGGGMSASSVSASYAAKYQYSSEGSSVMRTKLVPLPAPALLEERIRQMIKDRTPAPAPSPT
jgi:hypothetical protein